MANTFAHIELSTVDVGAAKKFYGKVFDWKLTDMPMGPGMTYTMIDVGKKGAGVAGGGMAVKAMPDAPTQWLPYVQVDSVKRTIAKARKNGARIVMDYEPIGQMGAIAIFVDPGGAGCGVWEAAKKSPKKPARKPAKKAAKKPEKRAGKSKKTKR